MKEKIIFFIKALSMISILRLSYFWIAFLLFFLSLFIASILFAFASDDTWSESMNYILVLLIFASGYFLLLLFGIFKFIEKYSKFIQFCIIIAISAILILSYQMPFAKKYSDISAEDTAFIFYNFVFSIPLAWIFRQVWCFFRDFRKKRLQKKYQRKLANFLINNFVSFLKKGSKHSLNEKYRTAI